jgi:hypothetical protein
MCANSASAKLVLVTQMLTVSWVQPQAFGIRSNEEVLVAIDRFNRDALHEDPDITDCQTES